MADLYDQYNAVNAVLNDARDAGEMQAGWLVASAKLREMMGEEPKRENWIQARNNFGEIFHWLLENDRWLEAAVMNLGLDIFNPRPLFVQRIFKAYATSMKLAVCGATSTSKSYSLIIALYHDLIRDPEFTSVRISTTTESNLVSNIFAPLEYIHRQAVWEIPGASWSGHLHLNIKGGRRDAGIHGIPFPKDQVQTGRYRGFHSQPVRRNPSRFGNFTRCRVLLDESSDMPAGIFKDLNSVLSGASGIENTKVLTAFNPIDISEHIESLVVPEGGWAKFDLDKDDEWKSRAGWNVVRLDGAKCENVVQRKVIYPKFITYDYYCSLLGQGETSAEYSTYARGAFPRSGTFNTIINRKSLEDSQHTPIFWDNVVEMAGVDTAMIQDSTIFTKARYGPAVGYTKRNGERVMYGDAQQPKAKMVLHIERQIKIPNATDETALSNEIIRLCKEQGVQAEWLVLDKTLHPGSAVFNNLKSKFGDILGIAYNEKATTRLMTADDVEPANKFINKVASELWFCGKRWFERGMISLGDDVQESPLFEHLCNRRKVSDRQIGGMFRAEGKEEYRARGGMFGGKSPDEADSLLLLPMLIRVRHDHMPSVVPHLVNAADSKEKIGVQGYVHPFAPEVQQLTAAKNEVDDQCSLYYIEQTGQHTPYQSSASEF